MSETLGRGNRMSMLMQSTPQYQTLSRGSVRQMSTQSGMLTGLLGAAENILQKCELKRKGLIGSIRSACGALKFDEYQNMRDTTDMLRHLVNRPNISDDEKKPMGEVLLKAAELMGIDRSNLLKDVTEQKSSLIENNPGLDREVIMEIASENVLFRTLTWHLNSMIKKYKGDAPDSLQRPTSSRLSILRTSFMGEGGRKQRRRSSKRKPRGSVPRRKRNSSRRKRTSSFRH